MSQFCTHCGAPIPEDARFCEACGWKVEPETDAADETVSAKPEDTGSDTDDTTPANPHEAFKEQFKEGFSIKVGPQASFLGGKKTAQKTFEFKPFADKPEKAAADDTGKKSGAGAPKTAEKAGGAAAPGNSGGAGGGVPKFALIGGGVAAAVVIAAIALGGGKKEKTDPGSQTTAAVEASADTGSPAGSVSAAGNNSTAANGASSGAAGQMGGMTASGQAAALDAAMSAFNGGAAGEDLVAKIRHPAGFTVKQDANLYDFEGEYEGTIQLTVMDGFENIEGVPDDFPEKAKEALSNPLPCEMEFEDDGEWEIEWDFYSGMGMRSRDLKADNPVLPEDYIRQRFKEPVNGAVSVDVTMTENFDDEESAEGRVQLAAEYGQNAAGTRQVVGVIEMHINMMGQLVDIAGDFVLDKTTEDVVPEAETVGETERDPNAPPVFDENDPASMAYYGIGGSDSAEENGESVSPAGSASSVQSSGVSSSALGKKAQALAGKQGISTNNAANAAGSSREIETVTGGQWTQMGSGAWIYEKSGRIVKDAWVETNGVYYYVDEDGYMLTSAYTPDGYYVGPDGGYDPYAPQNQSKNGTSSGGTSAGSSYSNLPDGLEAYDPSTFAYSGGKWDALPDGTYMYLNANGAYLYNQWVSDRGSYYFLAPDGSMIRNNYSSDGFWTGPDGAWDKSVPQRTDDVEPKNGTYAGNVSTWEIRLTKNGTSYGTATFSYTEFGGDEEYTLMPLGHSAYLAESEYGHEISALIVVSEDRNTVTVSQAGITEKCKLK